MKPINYIILGEKNIEKLNSKLKELSLQRTNINKEIDMLKDSKKLIKESLYQNKKLYAKDTEK